MFVSAAVAVAAVAAASDPAAVCGARSSDFRPNLTPKEVMQMGSFGGTYFRPIKSSVTGKSYRDVWKEFPAGKPSGGTRRSAFARVRSEKGKGTRLRG